MREYAYPKLIRASAAGVSAIALYAILSITILNIQSYPAVGGLWTVEFTTTGLSALMVTPVNGTQWDKDLIFQGLYCGDQLVQTKRVGNSYVADWWRCDQKGREVSKVISSGKHHLEFRFGDEIAYAHNDAANWVIAVSGGNATWSSTTGIDTCIDESDGKVKLGMFWDSFDRTDTTDISYGWSGDITSYNITNNKLVKDMNGFDQEIYASSMLTTDANYTIMLNLTNDTTDHMPSWYHQVDYDDYYGLRPFDDANRKLYYYKYVDGVGTEIEACAGQCIANGQWSAGEIIRIQIGNVSGTYVQVWDSTASQWNFTTYNDSYTSGPAGIGEKMYWASLQIDNYRVVKHDAGVDRTIGNRTTANIDAGTGKSIKNITQTFTQYGGGTVDLWSNCSGSWTEHQTGITSGTNYAIDGTEQKCAITLELNTPDVVQTPELDQLSIWYSTAGNGGSVNCTPPATGEWNITTSVICDGETFTMNGNISVRHNGGNLNITDSTITFNVTSDVEFGLYLEDSSDVGELASNLFITGSTLKGVNGSLRSWVTMRNNHNAGIEDTSTIVIEDTTFENMSSYYTDHSCAINLGQTDTATSKINNNSFVNCDCGVQQGGGQGLGTRIIDITNCTFDTISKMAVLMGGNWGNHTLSGCTFSDGQFFAYINNAYNYTIRNNYIDAKGHSGNYMIDIVTASYDVIIENNQFYNFQRGVYGQNNYDVMVRNNTFDTSNGFAIGFSWITSGNYDITITNNTLTNVLDGIAITHGGHNFTVTNNIIQNVTQNDPTYGGIRIKGMQGDINFTNNTVTNAVKTNQFNLLIEDSTDVQFSKASLIGQKYGIRFDNATDIVIRDVNVTENTYDLNFETSNTNIKLVNVTYDVAAFADNLDIFSYYDYISLTFPDDANPTTTVYNSSAKVIQLFLGLGDITNRDLLHYNRSNLAWTNYTQTAYFYITSLTPSELYNVTNSSGHHVTEFVTSAVGIGYFEMNIVDFQSLTIRLAGAGATTTTSTTTTTSSTIPITTSSSTSSTTTSSTTSSSSTTTLSLLTLGENTRVSIDQTGFYQLNNSVPISRLTINNSDIVFFGIGEGKEIWDQTNGYLLVFNSPENMTLSDTGSDREIRIFNFLDITSGNILNVTGNYSHLNITFTSTNPANISINQLPWIGATGFDRCPYKISSGNANMLHINTTSNPDNCYLTVYVDTVGMINIIVEYDVGIATSNLPAVLGGFAITIVLVVYGIRRRFR